MQPLNDDMDDLFRRASEEYPLNTQGADWSKVMQQLDHDENASADEFKRKRDFRSLWLLLLLPIGFICGRYAGHNGKHKTTVVNEIRTASAPSVRNTPAIAATGKQATEVKGTNAGVEGGNGERLGGYEGSKASTRSSSSEIEGSKTASGSGNATLASYSKQSTKALKSGTNAEVLLAKDALSTVGKYVSENKKSSSSVSKPRNLPNVNNNKSGFASIDTTDLAAKPPLQQDDFATTKDADSEKAASNQGVINTDTAKKIAATEKGKIEKRTNQHNLSYAIVFGPDVSTVKSQKASKVGYTMGVLLRYQLLRKISIEGGVLWARKNYYTEGKYLDTTHLKLLPWSKVKTADGYCDMFEIPINLKYNLITKKNNSWFLSAGVSSYLMKREEYDLAYERYNQLYTKNYAYPNLSKNWFSIMNISVGYQKSLGKNVTMDIAPYIKLPLQGIGIGKLPVSSKGLYLSLSKSIR